MAFLALAAVLFLATHLGMSSSPIRAKLVVAIGERGFFGIYSLIAFATLGYLIWLYNELPRLEYAWMPSPGLHMAAKVLMPVALILAVGGFLVRNPTSVGQEGALTGGAGDDLARGVIRITRHPFQWGVLIWAVCHVLANGDTNSLIFFGAFAVLAGAGSIAIDRRKAAALGGDWAVYAGVTSNLPFLAIVQGRNRLALGELWLPVLAGLALYGLLLWRHQWVSGARIL